MHKAEGQQVLVIACPIGVTEEPLLLVPAVAPIVAQFEGVMTVDEILKHFAPQGLQRPLIDDLIALLDQYRFLDNANFHAAQAKMRDDFIQSPTRPAALAGRNYSRESAELEVQIDSLLAHAPSGIRPAGTLITLVAPHVDYPRGGVTYGKTYEHLRSQEHDLYILIGTSHQYSKTLFHLTQKNFDSPLGLLPCDTSFVQELALRYGSERSFSDEILHRREHSLELQIPFLRRLKQAPRIVPILVGGFHKILSSGRQPQEFDEYESMAAGLAELIASRRAAGERVCIIAGVDMAHVGKQFGDSFSLTPEYMQGIAARDQLYLETLNSQDKARLFAHVAEDLDARRICGFPTMYTVLDVMDRLGIRSHSETFDYRQAVDSQRECGVTFAGLGMYEV